MPVALEPSLTGLCTDLIWKSCVLPVEGAVNLYTGEIPRVSSILLTPLVTIARQFCYRRAGSVNDFERKYKEALVLVECNGMHCLIPLLIAAHTNVWLSPDFGRQRI